MSTATLSPQISSSVDQRKPLRAAIASALIALRAPDDRPYSLQERSATAEVMSPAESDEPANATAEAATLAAMQIVRPVVEAAAEKSANLIGQFLDDYAKNLEELGCSPADAPAYLQNERQSLASLYHLAREHAPSPTELQRLALRVALDARRAVEGNMRRFTCRQTPEGWQITEYPSPAHCEIPLPPPGRCRLVRNSLINAVLSSIFADPPKMVRLMEIIETIFGGIPQKSETLEATNSPAFTFEVEPGKKTQTLRLCINGQEVPLPPSADVQKLLRALCGHPRYGESGRDLGRRIKVSNVSAAASRIRKALEQAHAGAGEWLVTVPTLHWAEDHFPTRISRPGKRSQ